MRITPIDRWTDRHSLIRKPKTETLEKKKNKFLPPRGKNRTRAPCTLIYGTVYARIRASHVRIRKNAIETLQLHPPLFYCENNIHQPPLLLLLLPLLLQPQQKYCVTSRKNHNIPRASVGGTCVGDEGRRRRLGFGKKGKSSFTVHRSEEVLPEDTGGGRSGRQPSSASSDGEGSGDGDRSEHSCK